MSVKYLVSIPAAGGRYGLTFGAARVVVRKIREIDPNAEIHYSGVSSGAFLAVLDIITTEKERTCDPKTKTIIHEVMHKELLDTINNEGLWKPGISEYFQNNDYFFKGLAKFIKQNLVNIDQINDKVYIGYCKLSLVHGLEFKIVSKFKDVDDLIDALFASSHYSWVLKNKHYYEYRGDRCVDGVFMHNSFCVPGYKNISVGRDVFNGTRRMDALLDISQNKFIELYKKGEAHQLKKQLDFQENIKGPELTNSVVKRIWNIIGTSLFVGSFILTLVLSSNIFG